MSRTMREPRPVARRPFVRTPLAVLAALLCQTTWAQSATDDEASPRLKSASQLQEKISPLSRPERPTFVTGDQITGQNELQTVVEGNGELRRADTVIRADRLEYFQPTDTAKARGNVFINRAGNTYSGNELELKVDAFEGFFTQPHYEFLSTKAYGDAARIDFVGENNMVVRNGTYSTCRPTGGPDWMPAWLLRADAVKLDQENSIGVAQNGVLEFYGKPVLSASSLSFPLSDARKSGWLPPSVGVSSRDGFEYTQPYYWNIAPNRDATFYPTVLSKRGLDLAGDFRYLENNYRGQMWGNYMLSDKLRNSSRWGYAVNHNGAIDTGFSSIGSLGVGLNLNRVSDNNYWRDFNRSIPTLTQRLLPTDVNITWGRDEYFAQLRRLKWQTLQDVTSPITPPYDRAPQLLGRYTRNNLSGFDVVLEADHTQFQADPVLTKQPNAQRRYAQAVVSRPWLTPGWFITPKLQLYRSDYSFSAPLTNGMNQASLSVPTVSLDGGLFFERDASYFGRAYRQTLEPRAMYVNTPYRNQSAIPVYDTALNDFNFATIYTENAFGGRDRISDANRLTLGVTSRLLAPETGGEIARFGIAQRLLFRDQLVTMPGGTPVTNRASDLLLGAAVNWTPSWMMDTTVSVNPETKVTNTSSISARFSPSNYRVINAAYRFQRDNSEQIDIGWQWPLNDLWGDKGVDKGPGRGLGPGRWYGVGRLNYDMMNKRMVDAIVGFEYDADCWIGRVVLDRLNTTLVTANTRILFQIEFVGFSRIGASPLQTLRQSIPRYQYLREQVTAPSRFSNYD
ncbi:LPS-assembly protein LptD [Curvibacter sp. HBC61]|uniref:LPS-assembly protein LptD n=1 Tax=Curvibacter cyanobacteriorum TaxID=3026422 RepID=A0ABT5MZI1_9BURK|nr:LPS-assembly protein LptD [Curvibacter sp. HBC61]MDD0839493.1 LPS-assembly protein LptD [Curvibacter sp. HBC61]